MNNDDKITTWNVHVTYTPTPATVTGDKGLLVQGDQMIDRMVIRIVANPYIKDRPDAFLAIVHRRQCGRYAGQLFHVTAPPEKSTVEGVHYFDCDEELFINVTAKRKVKAILETRDGPQEASTEHLPPPTGPSYPF